MSHAEYTEQVIYDKLETERKQEEAMDQKLITDNARLAQRLKGGG